MMEEEGEAEEEEREKEKGQEGEDDQHPALSPEKLVHQLKTKMQDFAGKWSQTKDPNETRIQIPASHAVTPSSLLNATLPGANGSACASRLFTRTLSQALGATCRSYSGPPAKACDCVSAGPGSITPLTAPRRDRRSKR